MGVVSTSTTIVTAAISINKSPSPSGVSMHALTTASEVEVSFPDLTTPAHSVSTNGSVKVTLEALRLFTLSSMLAMAVRLTMQTMATDRLTRMA